MIQERKRAGDLRSEFEQQIIFPAVRNPLVYRAFCNVDRALFTPADQINLAYTNEIIDIGEGSSISEPFLVAMMTDNLELTGEEKVLEVGTGSGYQAAILSHCSSEIHTIDINSRLAFEAYQRLSSLNYSNIHVHLGDGTLGIPNESPFDAIIVTAGAKKIPIALKEQLAVGGRIVVPTGNDLKQLNLIVGLKQTGGSIRTDVIALVRFHPLLSKHHGGWDPDVFEEARQKRIERRMELLTQLAAKLGTTLPELRSETARKFNIEPDNNWHNVDDFLVFNTINLILAFMEKGDVQNSQP
ncbi:protein-L-isoaspartate O-methyltransferase [Candidatus Curtissbacteria bacterium RIFCSPHIGHO2_02_FULL_42_15]|uniref:Protein-L-isoaspartate O-methyltransferase n=1 Tax=Candidatus Curtissbacteria bacterium RIFCSPHIGHO2_02_FULL_42_15 TaxID=1797716 RepID=A0A1F5GJZ4_9BACT|nr:MAG: protein-L-isoaspartate O-methyltransferase [Candidatus Curtissbacteria bacterium RIFCSPHIGHO2_02_FULL_42_15]